MFAPDCNDGKHVFVFGSNLRGRHGKGAALAAAEHWGAVEGVGFGRTGMAYAIPTKVNPRMAMTLFAIQSHVEIFLAYAAEHSDLTFLVTAIGCGLAGFTPQQIAPLFLDAPENCVLPEEFVNIIESLR
jgi:hypothetical protein